MNKDMYENKIHRDVENLIFDWLRNKFYEELQLSRLAKSIDGDEVTEADHKLRAEVIKKLMFKDYWKDRFHREQRF